MNCAACTDVSPGWIGRATAWLPRAPAAFAVFPRGRDGFPAAGRGFLNPDQNVLDSTGVFGAVMGGATAAAPAGGETGGSRLLRERVFGRGGRWGFGRNTPRMRSEAFF